MNKTKMFAIVRYRAEGFHFWQDAPDSRKYLRERHRHMFHVEAKVEVAHEEREIEYHDLLDFCRATFNGGEQWGRSCESMAKDLAKKIATRWPGRDVVVSVFEDGEVGATVCLT